MITGVFLISWLLSIGGWIEVLKCPYCNYEEEDDDMPECAACGSSFEVNKN